MVKKKITIPIKPQVISSPRQHEHIRFAPQQHTRFFDNIFLSDTLIRYTFTYLSFQYQKQAGTLDKLFQAQRLFLCGQPKYTILMGSMGDTK